MAQRTPRSAGSGSRTGRSDYYKDDYYDRGSYDEENDRDRSRSTRSAGRAGAGTTGASSAQRRSRPEGARSAASQRDYDRRRQAAAYRPAQSQKKRRKKKKSHGGLIAVLIILALLAGGGIYAWQSGLFTQVEEIIEAPLPVPEAPKVVSKATIGSTGDILLHLPVVNAHYTGYGYDFNYCFNNVANVYEQPDYMIANLEVTLGGTESGEYTGFPGFNSPDDIVPALKNAGVDMCLTANNHANDTGYYGMMRTLEVLDDYGIEHLGSRESTDEHFLMVKNINGIRLGMLCYTYDTREYTEGEISLNFNWLSDEAVPKMNTFNYEYLDEFYADVKQQMYYMDLLNVDASVVFMHWGTEYETYPNAYQTEIAQKLCDMGVDVIIGGHPHVIQEFDTLTSADGHQTICLYSMGNELSNQRMDIMTEEAPEGHTEDGLVIEVTFEKFNNGNVKVGAVEIIPTWVQLDGNGYQIIALDDPSDPWSWGSTDTYSAIASYNRTLARLGDGYTSYRQSKGQSSVQTYIE